jgi:hypothetical protein
LVHFVDFTIETAGDVQVVLIHERLRGFVVFENVRIIVEELVDAKVVFSLVTSDVELKVYHLVGDFNAAVIQVIGHWYHSC